VGVAAAEHASALSPTNLPEPVSELIGRNDTLKEVLSLRAAHRLVTLTGAGGIGKTRLAVAAVRLLRPRRLGCNSPAVRSRPNAWLLR
jgi:hypothetical protein